MGLVVKGQPRIPKAFIEVINIGAKSCCDESLGLAIQVYPISPVGGVVSANRKICVQVRFEAKTRYVRCMVSSPKHRRKPKEVPGKQTCLFIAQEEI